MCKRCDTHYEEALKHVKSDAEMYLQTYFLLRAFPYTCRGAPKYIICADCGNNGWGPMLTAKTWKSIVKKKKDRYNVYFFLCETCMEKRLGRSLISTDIRDCPPNYYHPEYEAHGVK